MANRLELRIALTPDPEHRCAADAFVSLPKQIWIRTVAAMSRDRLLGVRADAGSLNREVDGDCYDWFLDDRPLREIIADIDPDVAELLEVDCGLGVHLSDYTVTIRRSFLGLEPSPLSSGRCVLYSCSSCGDPYEGVLAVRVDLSGDLVRWHDFVIEYEDDRTDRKTGIVDPGTDSVPIPGLSFTFDRVPYEEVLAPKVPHA